MSNFNRLIQSTAAQQVKLLGGVLAVFQNKSNTIDCTVIIDRDVNYLQENGTVLANITVISLLKKEVGSVKDNDSIVFGCEKFTVKDVLSDDGVIVEVYVRG